MRQVRALQSFFERLLSALGIEGYRTLHERGQRGGFSEHIGQQVFLTGSRLPVEDQNLDVFAVRENLLNNAALHDNNDLSHGFLAYSGWSFAGAATKALRATREASTAHAAFRELRTIRSHLLRETGIKAKNRSASTPVVRASLPVAPCRLSNLNRT
jgi:hypothetical protein